MIEMDVGETRPPSWVNFPDALGIRNELRFAQDYLSTNKLYQSAKWAGELLRGMPEEDLLETEPIINIDQLSPTITPQDFEYSPDELSPFMKIFYEGGNRKQMEILNLARTLFELKEHRKCQDILSKSKLNGVNCQSGMFLFYYCKYLIAEYRKEENTYESGDYINRSTKFNTELGGMEKELRLLHDGDIQELNELNLYIYGLVLKERGLKEEAKLIFIEVLQKFPLFWSAWLELSTLLTRSDNHLLSKLPLHWTKNFFIGSFFLDLKQEGDAIEISTHLRNYFPASVYIWGQIAQAAYNSQEYDLALNQFEHLWEIDRYRYENIDLYSNILYIKENCGELANMAYEAFQTNKYRPETCTVVGNYYSLRGDHGKAVLYFKRAIKLDPKFLSAWTLMGHEFLELKNTTAAIESYRTAVDIDPTDFRAWYGLGQTYEILTMYNYACHYFANAALVKPQDSRMWGAMGSCYEKLNLRTEAIKCYERAEQFRDSEGIVLNKLANLYKSMNQMSKAAHCYEENLKRKDSEQITSKETIEAIIFLAKYYKKRSDYDKAYSFAQRLHDYNGKERDEATALIREINNLKYMECNM